MLHLVRCQCCVGGGRSDRLETIEANRIKAAVSVVAMRVIPGRIDASSILKDRALRAFYVRFVSTAGVAKQVAHLGFLQVEIVPSWAHKVWSILLTSSGRLAQLLILGSFCPL
jgi:hypothetical protein